MPDAAVLDTPVPDPPGSPNPSLQQYTELAELAGGFIHDIKNHLGTLSLNLQLLAEDFENPQTPRERRALERVNRLHGECQRLVELANDFLRFARVQELNRRPTTLAAGVTGMIASLAPTARRGEIEINCSPPPALPPVDLDEELFEQALLNLMLNAEQAMPDGGTLTLIGRKDGDAVCLDVIDTGCGMSPEVLTQVFRPFHTTKKDGNGLGLPTARKIVLAHGGAVGGPRQPAPGGKVTTRPAAAR